MGRALAKKGKADNRYQPSGDTRRFQSLGGGRWLRLFSPDGKSTVASRIKAPAVIAEFDADDRTPGWIVRQMQEDPQRWADVLEAVAALGENNNREGT